MSRHDEDCVLRLDHQGRCYPSPQMLEPESRGWPTCATCGGPVHPMGFGPAHVHAHEHEWSGPLDKAPTCVYPGCNLAYRPSEPIKAFANHAQPPEPLHVSLQRAYREGRRAVWNELIEHAEAGIRASREPLLASFESSGIAGPDLPPRSHPHRAPVVIDGHEYRHTSDCEWEACKECGGDHWTRDHWAHTTEPPATTPAPEETDHD